MFEQGTQGRVEGREAGKVFPGWAAQRDLERAERLVAQVGEQGGEVKPTRKLRIATTTGSRRTCPI
jgi:hypothetical protein